jgi:hypothetical protein
MSRFARYSLHNQLLIFQQRATASRVMGFQALAPGRLPRPPHVEFGTLDTSLQRFREKAARLIRAFDAIGCEPAGP